MNFSGWYLFTLRTITVATVPVIGAVDTVTESVMVAHLQQDGETLIGSHQVCSVDVSGATDMAKTILPDAFIESLAVSRYRLTLTEEDGIVHIAGSLETAYVGYDPRAGAFPAEVDDPSVRDTDGDGLAGATIIVDIPVFRPVTLQVAQRSSADITGTWTDGRFQGSSELSDFQQVVLAADHPLFMNPPALSVTTGDFTLEPLEGPTRCKDLRQSPEGR